MTEFNDVINQVLKQITPTKEQREKMERLSEEVLGAAKEEASKFNADAILAGSLTRDTWLISKNEFDVFVIFPKRISEEELEKKGLELGKKIIERLPYRFSDIYTNWFNLEYDKWIEEEGDDKQFVNNIVKYTDLVAKHMPNLYGTKLKYSIKYFLDGRNIKECKKILLSCRNEKDVIWLYNLAFIEAYQGDIKKNLSHYKRAAKRSIEPKIINQVEGFMYKMTRIEPDKYQIYFCLGYLNWKIKDDKKQAINDFSKFIALDTTDKYKEHKRLAQ